MSDPIPGRDMVTRLRSEHDFSLERMSDGERSLVMMSEKERRDEAADLFESIGRDMQAHLNMCGYELCEACDVASWVLRRIYPVVDL